jgi:C4-dicarboxylate-specific signal transduction histidine kinase
MRYADKQTKRCMSSSTNVTAPRKHWQKVQTELAHATRVMTLGELTASIAHEVNQPLAAIVTNGNAGLRWLRGERPNIVEAESAIERIIKDSDRASAVISRVRNLVKKSAPRNESIDLAELISEVLAFAESEARRHRVILKKQLALSGYCEEGGSVALLPWAAKKPHAEHTKDSQSAT